MSRLAPILDRLEALHGAPPPLLFHGALEMILWENVVYLADDAGRAVAFEALRKLTRFAPRTILAESDSALRKVTSLAGILPDNQVKKLRRIAQLVRDEFDGDLDAVLKLPLPKALRTLMKFPGIGEPGADKILLFSRTHPFLAPESNGLRVLLRLGFGEEQPAYAARYRTAQAAALKELPAECDALIRAHHLLRHHGQETCRRTRPACEECPLTRECRFYQEAASARRKAPDAR